MFKKLFRRRQQQRLLQFINRCKVYLAKSDMSPTFDPNAWTGPYKKHNCLSYALNLRVKRPILMTGCFNPETFAYLKTDQIPYTASNISDLFVDCCKRLGIKAEILKLKNLSKPPSCGYRVGLYVVGPDDNLLDFHFIRQDVSGNWSEKDTSKNLPEQITFSNYLDGYRLINVFEIKK